jgi:hypothetical protein
MKQRNLFKPIYVVAVVLMLVAVMAGPAMAQEPEEPDVGVQIVDFTAFLWNPFSALVARNDGTVVQKLNIEGAQQISGFTLAIAYDSDIIAPDDVRPGALLPGTEGVDYFFSVNPGGGGLACGGDSSFTINVAYLDPAMTIEGTGSLVEIVWRSDPAASVGDVSTVCLDGPSSSVVDNGAVMGPPVPSTFGFITVEPFNIFKLQIGLEGGKNSGLIQPAVPNTVFTDVKINGLLSCDGGGVDLLGYCAFNGAAAPPYTVEVSRFGYLDVETSFDPSDSSSVFMLAGDLNDDNEINILDIQIMINLFGPVGASAVSVAADYTGPGHIPDGIVNIMDLVLVAKNFGASGPTAGTPPGGDFPF